MPREEDVPFYQEEDDEDDEVFDFVIRHQDDEISQELVPKHTYYNDREAHLVGSGKVSDFHRLSPRPFGPLESWPATCQRQWEPVVKAHIVF